MKKTIIQLLIVDDVEQIRTGLSSTIDWYSLGIDKVYTARDGEEAYSLCNKHKIEIVLADVKMPGIDGLELGRRLCYTPLKIIIMSGFDDFSYAQSAIKMGALDYLLKPVNRAELITRIHMLVSDIVGSRCACGFEDTEEVNGLEQHQQIFGEDPKLSLSENNFNSFMLLAFNYINIHYAERMSINDVAEYVRKSNNYFSSYFKKKTGKTYTNYLAQVRIENAKRLLHYTTLMTYEIAEKVGFGDYKYFSSVFKSLVGCSPGEYRQHKTK